MLQSDRTACICADNYFTYNVKEKGCDAVVQEGIIGLDHYVPDFEIVDVVRAEEVSELNLTITLPAGTISYILYVPVECLTSNDKPLNRMHMPCMMHIDEFAHASSFSQP